MDPGRRQQIGASGHCRGPVCALTRYLGKQRAGKSSGDLSLLSLLAWNCIILILVTFLHFGLIENGTPGTCYEDRMPEGENQTGIRYLPLLSLNSGLESRAQGTANRSKRRSRGTFHWVLCFFSVESILDSEVHWLFVQVLLTVHKQKA